MSNIEELVAQIVEVTGTTESEAQHLLSACENNAEAAIAFYFDQGGGAGLDTTSSGATTETSNSAASTSAAAIPIVDDDDVRAPIAPIREQIIGPEDDNFFVASGPSGTAAGRIARASRIKVCPLRDFAREGELMEMQLMQAVVNSGPNEAAATTNGGGATGPSIEPGVSSWARDRSAQMMAIAMSRAATATGAIGAASSRLGDLFRPPTDIAYAGAFQAARMRATQRKLWLLVNVQSDNFASQVLNRDVWADKQIRKLIKPHFLLWQVDSESAEGRRFVTFYHCQTLPYVCIIDPRTGEEMWKTVQPKLPNLLTDLREFLNEHKDLSGLDSDAPSTSASMTAALKRREMDASSVDDLDFEGAASSNSSNSLSNYSKRTRVMELSEEEQIALAIKNSIRDGENGGGGKASSSASTKSDHDDVDDNVSDFGSVEEFNEGDSQAAQVSYEHKLGSSQDLTTMKLRLVNSEGHDEIVTLKWPSDTLVEVLYLYVSQKHPHIAPNSYKIICPYPRKTLEAENNKCTLKEMGLHPSANLHIIYDE